MALLTLTAGCGGGSGTLPVTGKLLWEDGSPIGAVNVQFVAAANGGGRDALGVTGANGEFHLTTFTYNDGAKPGEYTVVLVKFEGEEANAPAKGASMSPEEMAKKMKEFSEKQQDKPPAKDQFPPSYGNPKTSPIKWTVDSSHTRPEFKIPKP